MDSLLEGEEELMPRQSELSPTIDDLLKADPFGDDEISLLDQLEDDARLTPFDKLNLGIIKKGRHDYFDALKLFGAALEGYETSPEQNLRTYTLAHMGDCIKALGNQLARQGQDPKELYLQAVDVYGEVVKEINSMPRQFVPTILANAAIVNYNVGRYTGALQLCATYQVAGDTIKEFTTDETDKLIDIVMTKIMERSSGDGQA